MNIVWGHTHPQNKRPNAAVNNTMKTIKTIMVRPKMKKSCGQNTFPKYDEAGFGYIEQESGLPFT
jgi:hypothetical protein